MKISTTPLALGALLLVAGCDDKAPSTPVTPETPTTALGKTAKMGRDTKAAIEAQSQQAAGAAGAITGEKGNLTVGPLTFTVPEKFERVPAKGGQFAPAAEYKIAPLPGIAGEPAQLKFFEAGGSVEQNIARWKSQMGNPGVQPQTMTIGGLKVTRIAMEGTYVPVGMGAGAAPAVPGTRFVGAIIELGNGASIQIRMSGLREIVEPVEADFVAMVTSVQAK